MAPVTFHRFPNLPTEIRQLIWLHTFPSTDRLVCLYDWRWDFRKVDDPAERYIRLSNEHVLRRKRKVHVGVPTAFFVDQESRGIAEEWASRQELSWPDSPEIFDSKEMDHGLIDHCKKDEKEERFKPQTRTTWPTQKAMGRNFDPSRDYVYLGAEGKQQLKDELEKDLEVLQLDLALEAYENPEGPAPHVRRPFQKIMAQIKHLVVPAFMGYYSFQFIVDILKYRQVQKLYIVWGKLPEPAYVQPEAWAREREGKKHTADVQPQRRLERLERVTEGEDGDEVEMYSYVPMGREDEADSGNDSEPYVEKGSLAEWMEELEDEIKECSRQEAETYGELFEHFEDYVANLEIVPVRLVEG